MQSNFFLNATVVTQLLKKEDKNMYWYFPTSREPIHTKYIITYCLETEHDVLKKICLKVLICK